MLSLLGVIAIIAITPLYSAITPKSEDKYVEKVFNLTEIAITPKSEDKYVEKVFNWSEVHFSKMTCSKIHTLASTIFIIR